MLKKACAVGALVAATGAGALISSSPASATAPAWGGCCGSVRGRLAGFVSSGAFNANRNDLFNRIRLKIRNRNNNVAINNQRERQDERQIQRERRVRRPVMMRP